MSVSVMSFDPGIMNCPFGSWSVLIARSPLQGRRACYVI
jgi:hypothetical protein